MIDAHAHVPDAPGIRDLVVEQAQSVGVETGLPSGRISLPSGSGMHELVFCRVVIRYSHTFDGIETRGVVGIDSGTENYPESSRKVVAIGNVIGLFFADDTGAVISERRKNMQKSGFSCTGFHLRTLVSGHRPYALLSEMDA